MSKKKYQVEVCRISYGFNIIEVEAESKEQAKEKALDEAGDHEYSTKSADYDVNSVTNSVYNIWETKLLS